jgi:tetratricopeptide (TPR) repeat protein
LKRFRAREIIFVFGICAILQVWIAATATHAQPQFPKGTVKIVAPDGFSTSIYTQPNTSSEVLGIAFNGTIMETVGTQGDFVEVRVPDKPDKNATGFIPKDHTQPWQAPKSTEISPVVIVLAVLGVLVVIAILISLLKAKKAKELAQVAASIPASIKRGEELFRMSDYEGAIKEFKSYLSLQGSEVRSPDVYRRLAVSYQNVNDIKNAAHAWEKMRSLGGLKTMDDYTLGVELMISLGKESEAAEIYEHLLQNEADEDKRFDIHKKLLETYRHLKAPEKVIQHAVTLKSFGTAETSIIPDTVHYLFKEGKTDLALESNNKELIRGVCEEFIEEKAKTAQAARVYLKCLEYDRTDKRLHRLLADIYNQGGDYRRAVSELTILSQIDKEQSDQYIEEAAKIYMEQGKVAEALAEGNPLVIKKIAQAFLVRSEVNAEAVSVYEKVLEFQPRAVGINRMLSTVYLTRGELDKYMEKLRLLHEIDGKNHDYLSDLAQCVIDNDLIDQTIREGNRELNSKILKYLIKRGASNDKAVSLFEKLVKLEPDNALIRSALVKAYQQRGESIKGFEHLLALIRLQDDEALYGQAAKVAVEHKLLEQIMKEQSPKLLAATAQEITRSKERGSDARKVLEMALNENPSDRGLKDYLKSLESARKPKPEATTPPKPAPKAPAAPPEKQARAAKPEPPQAPEKPAEKKRKKPEVKRREKTPEKPESPSRPQVTPSLIAELDVPLPPPEQSIPLVEDELPFADRAVTTFVSGSFSPGLADLSREELFIPSAGGLAYKEMEILVSDGWGNLHVGAEVNTGKSVLMRVFRKDLLETSSMEEFVNQVTDLGYNLVHESILPLEEVVRGPGGAVAFVHPFYSHTLEAVIKSRRRPDLKERIALIGKLLEGMAYAHNYKGIDGKLRRTYHLHLQPQQVLVDDKATKVQFCSFGYSQIYRNLTRAKYPRWQEPGMNPVSMPPEFFRSRSGTIKERSADIYSLGVLMYFVATGEFPFEGPSFDDYKFQHTKIFAAPPRLIDPAVPDWLEPIILGCLEKEPDKRWGSVAEMHQDFARSHK